MKPLVILPQLRARYMRIYLRRRDIRVPEHLLDRTNIGVILHKMRCKRVAQRMR